MFCLSHDFKDPDIYRKIAAICSLEPQVVLGISEYFQDVEHIATLPIVENAAG